MELDNKRFRLTNERIKRPRKQVKRKRLQIKYEYAEELADSIGELNTDDIINVVVSGRFIFGDFIEAFIVKNNYHCKHLTISTLSFSQENVDSLANLIKGEYVDELNLIIADYQYSHERGKGGLVHYAYENLDIDNKFQLSVARCHVKTVLIETYCGKNFVFHGSANLRSSDCIEQICIEENKELHNFHKEWQDALIESFKTIRKSVRSKEQWQKVKLLE